MNNNAGETYRPTEKDYFFSPEERRKTEPKKKKSGGLVSVMTPPTVNTFLKGLIGGIIIALTAIAYLSLNSKTFSPLVLSVGFLICYSYGYYLFTDKVSSFIEQNARQNFLLIPTFLGNLVGSVLVGIIARHTDIFEKINKTATSVSKNALKGSLAGIFILAIFCGILLYVGADSFKNAKTTALKYLILIFSVMVFAFAKFEFSIADMFYFTLTGSWSLGAIGRLLVITLGNAIGTMIIPVLQGIMSLVNNKNTEKIKKRDDKPEEV